MTQKSRAQLDAQFLVIRDETLEAINTALRIGVAFIDGLDSYVHGTEDGATVKTLYEGNANTNAFSDAEQTKLAGIATGATATPLSMVLPQDVGTAAIGVGTAAARSDHIHAHGSQGGGTEHAVAVPSGAAGFISGVSQQKVNDADPSATGDHAALTNLNVPAHHLWASLIDGTRPFTAVVSGIDPTSDAHLATKKYVDDLSGAVSFIALDDTPADYISQARKALTVNAAEDGVEFVPGGDTIAGDATTGVLSGGLITAGVGAGQVTVADGSGRIIDYTTPGVPTVQNISWSGITDIAITAIATTQVTFLLVNSSGNLLQVSGSRPTEAQRRTNMFIGFVTHFDNVNVSDIISEPALAYGSGQDFKTVVQFLDGIILSGADISANGANLSLNVSAATFFDEGINFHTSKANPSVASFAGDTLFTFDRIFGDGVQGGEINQESADVTVVDPSQFNNSGTLASPGGGNSASIQRVYLDPVGNMYVSYGQEAFGTFSNALSNVGSEFYLESAFELSSKLLARIVLAKTATDLSDTAQAVIVNETGISGGGGGGGGGAHAALHSDGGTDEVTVENLATAATDTELVLKPNGAGGVAFGAQVGLGVAPAINLYNTSSQTLSTTLTALLWTTDRVDDNTHFTFSDGGSLITVLIAGTYTFRAFATARPDSVSAGTGFVLHFLVNGGGGLTSAKPRVDFPASSVRVQNYIEVTRSYDVNDTIQIGASVTAATTGQIEANTVGLTAFRLGDTPP